MVAHKIYIIAHNKTYNTVTKFHDTQRLPSEIFQS